MKSSWGHKKMDVKHVGAAAPAADKCTTVACRLVKACYEIVTGFSGRQLYTTRESTKSNHQMPHGTSRCRKVKRKADKQKQEDMGRDVTDVRVVIGEFTTTTTEKKGGKKENKTRTFLLYSESCDSYLKNHQLLCWLVATPRPTSNRQSRTNGNIYLYIYIRSVIYSIVSPLWFDIMGKCHPSQSWTVYAVTAVYFFPSPFFKA